METDANKVLTTYYWLRSVDNDDLPRTDGADAGAKGGEKKTDGAGAHRKGIESMIGRDGDTRLDSDDGSDNLVPSEDVTDKRASLWVGSFAIYARRKYSPWIDPALRTLVAHYCE